MSVIDGNMTVFNMRMIDGMTVFDMRMIDGNMIVCDVSVISMNMTVNFISIHFNF